MPTVPEPLERRTYDAAALIAEHPPIWRHPNKEAVAAISCPPDAIHGGTLGYSRWPAMPLPGSNDGDRATTLVERPGFYDYAPIDDAAVAWHVNFADPHLFAAYGSPLLAQDELQVAEHPILGALREALVADGAVARTMEGGRPTPVLVTGVERRCRIATEPDAAAGRPEGLYGNRFADARADVVRRATSRLEPPTVSNVIAMAAPGYGHGVYTAEQIEGILVTATTAFAAARTETANIRDPRTRVVVHTGFWGCGAFGGNRVLMAALQVIAARLVGVDTLAFHVGDPTGAELLADAIGFVDGPGGVGASPTTRALVEAVAHYGFRWGVSDGT